MGNPRTRSSARNERLDAYWRENQRLIYILTIIWAIVTFAHVPFAKQLNQVQILTGFPLGYWLSSQGSITVFVIEIFVYAFVMNRIIDPKYGFGEDEE
jgi:putative solute:sodium symporter small subunit